MRAYVMTAPGRLAATTVPVPGPLQPGEVLLRVLTVGVCRTDVSHFSGITSCAYPAVPGHEVVGEVVTVGPGAVRDHVRVGDILVYFGQTDFGGLAELRVIRPLFLGMDASSTIWDGRGFEDADAAAACVLPESLNQVQAVVAEPAGADLRSIGVTPPLAGARVLVTDGGLTGQLALRLLKRLYGVESVDVLEVNPHRRELARRHGARAA
jgi:L-gulonate 5-dehydrogenase